MAEKSDQPLSVNTPDAGAAFRFEMFLQNVVLGYWWVVAIAIGAMLAAVAVWGFVDSSHNSAQRTTSAETAAVFSRVERQLLDHEKIDEYTKQSGLTVRVVPSWDGIRAGQRIRLDMAFETALAEFPKEGTDADAVLTEAGDELMAVHARGSGTAAAHAAFAAADMYRLAGDEEGQLKALEAAKASGLPPMQFGADVALALRAASADDLSTADDILRAWIVEERGFYGQQAALELGGIYQAADRDTDAQAVYDIMRQIWPTSPLLDQVDERLEGMGLDVPERAVIAPTDEGAPADDGAPAGDGTPADEGGE